MGSDDCDWALRFPHSPVLVDRDYRTDLQDDEVGIDAAGAIGAIGDHPADLFFSGIWSCSSGKVGLLPSQLRVDSTERISEVAVSIARRTAH
jgi:uncharacterized OsmC-like protein